MVDCIREDIGEEGVNEHKLTRKTSGVEKDDMLCQRHTVGKGQENDDE